MTNGVYDPHSSVALNSFINSLIQQSKKYRPSIFIDVVPAEHFNERIKGKINTQLKGIPDFKIAIKFDEITIDEFATSLAMKIQVSRGIFADYISFHKLEKKLLDGPMKIIDELLLDCEKTLENQYMVHADVYYSRFNKMLAPMKLIKESFQSSLKNKGITATEENDLVIYYAQQLIALLEFGKIEFAAAPAKPKRTVNTMASKR